MIRSLWYYTVHAAVTLILFFYFRKRVILNKHHIPATGAVLFLPNHQNALLDALLVATATRRRCHFLTRADIFKRPLVRWLLSTVNMVPVYRMRDGWQALAQNAHTFHYCREVFQRGEALLMFPEGNHGEQRRLRPLSTGFVKVLAETMRMQHDVTITIVPVGLNFSHAQQYYSDVSIVFGKPIPVAAPDALHTPEAARALRDRVASALKQLITHIDDVANYEFLAQQLHSTQPNYLDPADTNSRLKQLDAWPKRTPKSPPQTYRILTLPVAALLTVLNAVPLLLWHNRKQKITDVVFTGTLRFAIGATVVPVYYAFITYTVFYTVGLLPAFAVFVFCLMSLPWLSRCKV